jgi:hypothetical protein
MSPNVNEKVIRYFNYTKYSYLFFLKPPFFIVLHIYLAREVELYPNEEEEEIIELFEPYGLDRASMEPMMIRFRQNTDKFVDFMMRFELNLEVPDPNRIWVRCLDKKKATKMMANVNI